jgi:predicted NAD-dependent protein-ADP-ribosyltransferase YbiA (DUF1768 family)
MSTRKGGTASKSSSSSKSSSKTKKVKKQELSKEDKAIIESNVVYFLGKSKGDIKLLSNFSKCEINIDNVLYPSGEHAYHGEKYRQLGLLSEEPKRREDLLKYSENFTISGDYKDLFEGKVKAKGGKNGLRLEEGEMKTWGDIYVETQKKICRWKYDMCPGVKQALMSTGDKLLVHLASRKNAIQVSKSTKPNNGLANAEGICIVENGKVKVLGPNMLGKIWTEIRDNVKLSEVVS